MKKLLNKDLVKKSVKDLVALRKKIRRELFDHTLKNRMRALKQTHLIPLARKNIARINTAMTTIRLQAAKESVK